MLPRRYRTLAYTFALSAFLHSSVVTAPAEAPPATKTVYVLEANDQVSVHVLDFDEIADKPLRLDARGFIDLPVLGRVPAAGLSAEQLEIDLATRLRKYLKEPNVTVAVSEFRDHPVSVLGAVATPGVKQVHGAKTLFEIISEAGGLRTDSGPYIKITRPVSSGPIPLPGVHNDMTGDYYVAQVSVQSAVTAANPSENITILPHDVITVPRAELVYVLGEVGKPGGYEIGESESISILDALSKAGGVIRNANASHAKVLHSVSGQSERAEIPVDLNRILGGKDKDYSLRPHDILYIPTNRGKMVANRAIEAMVGAGTSLAIFRGSR